MWILVHHKLNCLNVTIYRDSRDVYLSVNYEKTNKSVKNKFARMLIGKEILIYVGSTPYTTSPIYLLQFESSNCQYTLFISKLQFKKNTTIFWNHKTNYL